MYFSGNNYSINNGQFMPKGVFGALNTVNTTPVPTTPATQTPTIFPTPVYSDVPLPAIEPPTGINLLGINLTPTTLLLLAVILWLILKEL